MLKDGATVRCAQCGVRLDIPDGVSPRISIEGASGRSNMRVLSIDGQEIHRCTVITRADLASARRVPSSN
jgi:hypothetical protein